MKTKIISAVIAFTLIAGISTSASADVLSTIIGQFGKGADYICRQAKWSDFKFSIRSGRGIACKQPIVAAFAELICDGYGEDGDAPYSKSGCHENAEKALDGKDATKVLMDMLPTKGIGIISKVCSFAGKLPGLSTICDLIE